MSDGVTLYLVRHADAVDAAAARGDDASRALTARGNAQARLVALSSVLLEVGLQRVLTSPKLRAVQTAEALRAATGPATGAPLEILEQLARGDPPATLRALADALAPSETRIALVGHEPHLSALAAYLLTGDAAGARVEMRQASVATLAGPLRPGAMTLTALIPVQHVQALAGERIGRIGAPGPPGEAGSGRH